MLRMRTESKGGEQDDKLILWRSHLYVRKVDWFLFLAPAKTFITSQNPQPTWKRTQRSTCAVQQQDSQLYTCYKNLGALLVKVELNPPSAFLPPCCS
jgi:hypothetical protein